MKNKEGYVFEIYKNRQLNNSIEFVREVEKFKIENPNELYRKIVNYQIKKFGSSLNSKEKKYFKEEQIQRSKNAYSRKYRRRKGN